MQHIFILKISYIDHIQKAKEALANQGRIFTLVEVELPEVRVSYFLANL
jgi:hypothetical protein